MTLPITNASYRLAPPPALDVARALLATTLAENEYLDVLIDPIGGFASHALAETLPFSHQPALIYKTLLDEPLFQNVPDDAPYLLRFRHTHHKPYDLISQRDYVQWISQFVTLSQCEAQGTRRSVCAILTSTLGQQELAHRLSANLNLRLTTQGQSQAMYFRFFDPRVTHGLGTLLDKQRYQALRDPLLRWHYPHWSGRWLELPAKQLQIDGLDATTLAPSQEFSFGGALAAAARLLREENALPGQMADQFADPADDDEATAFLIHDVAPADDDPIWREVDLTTVANEHLVFERRALSIIASAWKAGLARPEDWATLAALDACHGDALLKNKQLGSCFQHCRESAINFYDLAREYMRLEITRTPYSQRQAEQTS